MNNKDLRQHFRERLRPIEKNLQFNFPMEPLNVEIIHRCSACGHAGTLLRRSFVEDNKVCFFVECTRCQPSRVGPFASSEEAIRVWKVQNALLK